MVYTGTNESCLSLVFSELAAERLVDERVHGLCDADDTGEDDAPSVAVEAVGGGDGDDAEQDTHAEGRQAHVVGGDVLLERLNQRRRDEGDDAGYRVAATDGCGVGVGVEDPPLGLAYLFHCAVVPRK